MKAKVKSSLGCLVPSQPVLICVFPPAITVITDLLVPWIQLIKSLQFSSMHFMDDAQMFVCFFLLIFLCFVFDYLKGLHKSVLHFHSLCRTQISKNVFLKTWYLVLHYFIENCLQVMLSDSFAVLWTFHLEGKVVSTPSQLLSFYSPIDWHAFRQWHSLIQKTELR